LGAGLINDVRSLRRDGALEAAAATGLPVCLMHMLGEPGDMQDNDPHYDDLVGEVSAFLGDRNAQCARCAAAGIEA
jgi:dihydropteroate synthase